MPDMPCPPPAAPDTEKRETRRPAFKRVFGRREAAEYLGMSVTHLDDLRRRDPFWEADSCDRKTGGFAVWDVKHLDIMADVILGQYDLATGRDSWLSYKSARALDVHDLLLSIEDKYLRLRRLERAEKLRKTLEAKEARQAKRLTPAADTEAAV